jgi:anti-anti-sigma factor
MVTPSGGALQPYSLLARHPQPGIVVLAVRDELDRPAAPFHDCLHGLRHPDLRHLVIDLTAVTFVSAAGLRMLVDARPPRVGIDSGYAVHLAGVGTGSMTLRLLRITDLDALFTTFDGVDACLASPTSRGTPS